MSRFAWMFALVAAVSAAPGLACAAAEQVGNPEQGKADFAICSACHQIGPGAKSAIGPVLNGVVGRKAGTYPGYEVLRREQELRHHVDRAGTPEIPCQSAKSRTRDEDGVCRVQ